MQMTGAFLFAGTGAKNSAGSSAEHKKMAQ
jgi:hypothetical protein